MIAAITGILEALDSDGAVVRVGGVSLRVVAPTSTIEALGALGSQVRLHTHLQVTEDALHLYGFSQEAGLRMFQMLLTVAGVGPRVALGVLSTMGPGEIAGAIASDDADALSRAPGVGKRTASRIILELRDRLEREGVVLASPGIALDGEVVAALRALGYSDAEARQAVRGLGDATGLDLEERVRRALQQLGASRG